MRSFRDHSSLQKTASNIIKNQQQIVKSFTEKPDEAPQEEDKQLTLTLHAKLQELKNELEQRKLKIQNLQKNFEDLANIGKRDRMELEQLRQAKKQDDDKIRILESKLQQAYQELNMSKSAQEHLRTQLENYKNEFQLALQKNKSSDLQLDQKVKKLEVQLTASQNEAKELRVQLQKQQQVYNLQAAELNQQIKDLQKNLQNLQQNDSQKILAYKNLQDECQLKDHKINQLEKKLQESEQKSQQAINDLLQQRKEFFQAQEAIKSYKEQIQEIQSK